LFILGCSSNIQYVKINRFMKLYLSSYRLGDDPQVLVDMVGKNKRAAVIPNALDNIEDKELIREKIRANMDELINLGFNPEVVDLKKYFGKHNELFGKMSEFGLIWVRGGNTFILRRAYKQSGFDKWLLSQKNNKELVYGGYSAGCCILSPTLKGLEIVDEPNIVSKGYSTDVIWDGLDLIDFIFVPHYKSDHPESVKVDETIRYYKKKGMIYKTVRDGEVIVQEI